MDILRSRRPGTCSKLCHVWKPQYGQPVVLEIVAEVAVVVEVEVVEEKEEVEEEVEILVEVVVVPMVAAAIPWLRQQNMP